MYQVFGRLWTVNTYCAVAEIPTYNSESIDFCEIWTSNQKIINLINLANEFSSKDRIPPADLYCVY